MYNHTHRQHTCTYNALIHTYICVRHACTCMYNAHTLIYMGMHKQTHTNTSLYIQSCTQFSLIALVLTGT